MQIEAELKFYVKDNGAYLERRDYGLHSVKIDGKDFSTYAWGYQVILRIWCMFLSYVKFNCLLLTLQNSLLKFTSYFMKVGLSGENLQIYTDTSKVQWHRLSSTKHPMTWYKVRRKVHGNAMFSFNL